LIDGNRTPSPRNTERIAVGVGCVRTRQRYRRRRVRGSRGDLKRQGRNRTAPDPSGIHSRNDTAHIAGGNGVAGRGLQGSTPCGANRIIGP
jgi:hypothetical protein